MQDADALSPPVLSSSPSTALANNCTAQSCSLAPNSWAGVELPTLRCTSVSELARSLGESASATDFAFVAQVTCTSWPDSTCLRPHNGASSRARPLPTGASSPLSSIANLTMLAKSAFGVFSGFYLSFGAILTPYYGVNAAYASVAGTPGADTAALYQFVPLPCFADQSADDLYSAGVSLPSFSSGTEPSSASSSPVFARTSLLRLCSLASSWAVSSASLAIPLPNR